jgi:putative hemolysin
MLWRGILEYLSKTQADLLFGCATVMSQDPLEVSRLIRYLRELNVVDRKFRVVPKKKLPGVERLDLSRPLTTEEREQAQRLLPPLCSAYIKAGAKLAEIPAWDPDFRCVDFMTILEKDKISPLFLRRYGASMEG